MGSEMEEFNLESHYLDHNVDLNGLAIVLRSIIFGSEKKLINKKLKPISKLGESSYNNFGFFLFSSNNLSIFGTFLSNMFFK